MPTAAQHTQLAIAVDASNQAGDLGRADIQHAERPGRPCRGAAAVGRSAGRQHATRHVVHGAGFLGVSARAVARGPATAARTRRSPSRMSIAATDDRAARVLLQQQQPIESCDLMSFRQQNIGAVFTADSSGVRRCASPRRHVLQSAVRSAHRTACARVRRAWAYDEGDHGIRDLCPPRPAPPVDQHKLALVLPDRERTSFLQRDDNRAGQAAFDRRVRHPGQLLNALPRLIEENPTIGSPVLTPRAARSNGSGVLARPSMTISVTRRPATPGTAEAVRAPMRRAAGCAERNKTTPPASAANATQAPAAPAQRWRRSSSFHRLAGH